MTFYFFIPLPFSGDCSPVSVSKPTTWLMFAAPMRGLELSEIWDLFIQICEILSQQWNCIFSPLDVVVFLFPSCFQTSSIIFYVSEFFLFHARKFWSFVGSRTRVVSFRSPLFFHCASQPWYISNYIVINLFWLFCKFWILNFSMSYSQQINYTNKMKLNKFITAFST